MTEENQGITGQKRALEDGEPSPDGAAPAEEPTDAAPAPTPEEPSAAVEATGGAAPTAEGGAEAVPGAPPTAPANGAATPGAQFQTLYHASVGWSESVCMLQDIFKAFSI